MQRPENSNKLNGVHPKRAGKPINESLNKRLAVYALAATAAGVGALALAPPAEASIVFSDTSTSIVPNNALEHFQINGVDVLFFSDDFFASTRGGVLTRASGALGMGGAQGIDVEKIIVGPLAKSASIGPGGAFGGTTFLAKNTFRRSFSGKTITSKVSGPWANKTGYLGFEFKSNGSTFFGWAHLSVKANAKSGESGVISSFAYEDTADTPILAGEGKPTPPTAAEPGALTLSLLALGAVGLYELRRRLVAQRS